MLQVDADFYAIDGRAIDLRGRGEPRTVPTRYALDPARVRATIDSAFTMSSGTYFSAGQFIFRSGSILPSLLEEHLDELSGSYEKDKVFHFYDQSFPNWGGEPARRRRRTLCRVGRAGDQRQARHRTGTRSDAPVDSRCVDRVEGIHPLDRALAAPALQGPQLPVRAGALPPRVLPRPAAGLETAGRGRTTRRLPVATGAAASEIRVVSAAPGFSSTVTASVRGSVAWP